MLNKVLRLERSIAVLDLETTGLDKKKDRIIQMGVTIHYPHKDPIDWVTLINPEVPIKNQGSHHITDEMVKTAPKFKDIAEGLAKHLLASDIAGHNVMGFDIDFIKFEMHRAGVAFPWTNHIVDTLSICRLKLPHTLSNAYKHFVDKSGFEDAHDAGADVAAATAVLHGQLNTYADLPRTVPELAEFCLAKTAGAIDRAGKIAWINEQPCLTFGKWKGTPLQKVDKSYLIWMINSDNFGDDVVIILGQCLKGIFPVKEVKNDGQ